jgi:multiple sugar transport system ATP-binding protein
MTADPQAPCPAIELIQVEKRYGNKRVLESVDLSIQDGEFVALLGPSGCGKSTLLKLIAGLDEVSDGEIYIGGKLANYLKPGERNVSMVFQNYALYPHMTVGRNIGFPLKVAKLARSEIAARVNSAAELLQLGDYLDRYPDELSGGQRQRVALGRAIVREPLAFLMDEPLSNLDAILRVEMRTELLRLHKRVGRTTVYVTHDQVEAMTMADRIVVMRDGVIQQIGTPDEIYEAPTNIFVARFVGSAPMNLFACKAKTDGTAGFDGDMQLDLPDWSAHELHGRNATVGVRPEHLELVPSGTPGATSARVDVVERVGADMFVFGLLANGETAVARVENIRPPQRGDEVHFRPRTNRLHIFNESGERITPAV